MTKDHGNSVKNDKQYEGLRQKGMSKARAARIANSPSTSKRGGRIAISLAKCYRRQVNPSDPVVHHELNDGC